MSDPARWQVPTPLEQTRAAVDPVLLGFLADRRAELAAMDPAAAAPAEELERITRAGGKRIRPALCIAAFRAAGGPVDARVLRAAAALELLHVAALVHDDVMDRTAERRDAPASHVRFEREAPAGTQAAAFGVAAAIVAGDLGLVLSEQLLRTSGFEGELLTKAMGRFDRMRLEMAAGQFLDVAGRGRDPRSVERVAALKTSSYTAEGPVLVGSALAGAEIGVEGAFVVFGRFLGQAYQLRDDLLDGEASPEAAARVDELVTRAIAALREAPLQAGGADAMIALAELVRPGVA